MGLDDLNQSKLVGGFTYEVTPLPFGQGRKALMRLVKIMSPILAGAFGAEGKSASAAGVFQALPTALSDADLDYFSKLFGDTTRFSSEANPKKLVLTVENQELHFAGRYLEFVQWLTFCIEVNFKGFFSGMANQEGVGAVSSLFSS